MKKLVLLGIAVVVLTGAAVSAQSESKGHEDNARIAELEKLAEKGDTAAMHRLIEFYDENSVEYVEI